MPIDDDKFLFNLFEEVSKLNDLTSCPACKLHVQLFGISCGHSLCKDCLKCLKCAICSEPITEIVADNMIMLLADKTSKLMDSLQFTDLNYNENDFEQVNCQEPKALKTEIYLSTALEHRFTQTDMIVSSVAVQCDPIQCERMNQSTQTDFPIDNDLFRQKLNSLMDLQTWKTFSSLVERMMDDSDSSRIFLKLNNENNVVTESPKPTVSVNDVNVKKNNEVSDDVSAKNEISTDNGISSISRSLSEKSQESVESLHSVSKDNKKVKKQLIKGEFRKRKNSQPEPIIENEEPLSVRRSRRREKILQQQKYFILCSGLNGTERYRLEMASRTLQFKFLDEWTLTTTHLVMNDDNRLTTRSLKYLLALLTNKWIVSFDWILDCIRSGCMVDEAPYEIRGVKNFKIFGCPEKSRKTKITFFKNYAVQFAGNFSNLPFSFEDLEYLVEVGKGLLVKRESDFTKLDKNLKCIIVTENVTLSETQDSVKFVSLNQFLDSITNLEPL